MSEPEFISVKGAREHNLKSVTFEIPKKKLVVFTGVSGSGKSSLAFDTLYAEGQRRYVESLSSYARQFLGQMEKPKYDTLRGLSPTISIEQKAASNNPRSTVGTITEVHDYLRVLYASIGVQHCPGCGRAVGKQTAQQIVDTVLGMPEGARILVLAPLVQNRKGEYRDLFADLAKRGFSRVRVDGMIHQLTDRLTLDKKLKHDIELVVDRLVVKDGIRPRLTDSVETALREGKGTLVVADADKEQKVGPGDPEEYKRHDRFFSELNACHACGLSFGELTPPGFSFNSPLGFCPDCQGLGTRPEMDPDLIVPDPSLTIREGAVEPWASGMERGEGWTFEFVEHLSRALKLDLDTPWSKLPKKDRDVIMLGTEAAGNGRYRLEWEGVVNQLYRRFKATGSEAMRRWYMRFFSDKPCPTCNGERLKPESRAVRIRGRGIVELSHLTIADAHAWLSALDLGGNEARIADELLKEIRNRLKFLLDVGLGYLTLDRPGPSLSGGESQRIRLASQMGSELTGVIYILDEPSIGLHQRDNGKLLATLKRLRDVGNSVIVVEHDEETMEEADWIVDFGPGAGAHGGEVVAEGTPEQVKRNPRSLTGAYLSGRAEIPLPERRRAGDHGAITIFGAREHNLKDVTATFPLGRFVAVTGVSGAGKSTLVNRILRPALMRHHYGTREAPGAHERLEGAALVDKVIDINQQPIGRTPRSNPATYTKLFDHIREVFAQTPEARAFGYQPGRFSFNVKGGRCEACQGDGMKLVEMHFLADVLVPCEVCGGKRFNDATLRVTFKGKNVAEVLDLSVTEAGALFQNHKEIARILRTLEDVGLGYLKLGQPSTTLSGGEAQRIKLSRELARVGTGRTLYVLDEPTTGLHFEDVKRLLHVLDRLVDAGNSVVVIEHNLDVIKYADWVMDLGPEGGDEGGRIIAEGTPEEVARARGSYTGEHLAKVLAAHAARRRTAPSRAAERSAAG
ncbi:excinuclease ABC, A subunit [Anaeromyxobacter dehalogenans 2CP-1]|uniref:UvrABC system protein A n=1 Tax=Anaeromyxobacter dehalogenans (strain ATCC BAA-258 / DSM 21875 / 2CP-1) TaxID=455488 RepID=B8JGC9_ANAD2|nr:excinuclease ABC subunit UvrA [Anaeromyxobacter dehalogenans]ACL64600.1 excinuclease ABC, A subunit [Anaeromyxobacter dehalogenans 2CP-1]